MNNIKYRIASILLLVVSVFLLGGAFKSDTFKVLRIKGNATIDNNPIKPGQEYDIKDIEKLSFSTPDKSGLVIVCYNNCAKNKVILEKTISNYSSVQKRQLLETTAYKTRGGSLESLPELVNYFEQKPILILADNMLSVNPLVLNSPNDGSFLEMYYMDNFTDVIQEIPYLNNSFTFNYNMFTSAVTDTILGPVTLTVVDPIAGREQLVTEEFYVAFIDDRELEKYVKELLSMDVNEEAIIDALFEMLKVQYPDYYVEKDFVKQYMEQR
ncbi:hypothetical protein [Plebeiibacterium sediminum]|uniref:Uncharacterized protein n=1 Tax=Plebeiibacterium sediminum TaxID=2992112 RepID=A0AAE3SEG6_9BACT|nr:hypothetical protein [Plebeiobacterium sediminum]MCW3786448.1 hypothetical protein [Plebeiobacterium sediminum]